MRHPAPPLHRRRGRPLRGLLAFAAALLLIEPCFAAPFVPHGDDEVVETLPRRLDTPAQRHAQREARAQLQREPAQLPLALGLARQAITRARQQGDPRELGQAQAALAPWWNLPEPPPAVRLLRATVRQSQHDFSAALRDLDALVEAPRIPPIPLPVQAQAELTRAAVLQVLGRWQEAQAGCERLQGPRYAALGDGARRPAQACLAELRSLQGEADAAARTLRSLARGAPAGEAAWLALLQAELAERRGDAAAAQGFYRTATEGEQPEVYPLAARADWLLDQQRPAEVVPLLQGREDADALLLRLAIAWQRTGDPRAAAAGATLQARFDEAARRGDAAHARERARFELDVRQQDPAAALREAQANWALQKEPADALLLARAARAAGQPAAAQPVWDFVRTTGLQDARLQPLREAQP